MALKRPKGSAGTLVVLDRSSKILKRNPLGDPHVGTLGVWRPPQCDDLRKKRFPVLPNRGYRGALAQLAPP